MTTDRQDQLDRIRAMDPAMLQKIIDDPLTSDSKKAQLEEQRTAAAADSTGAAVDPYGTSGISNQSVRRRGSSDQTRVGTDTRVRDDDSSGTAGAAGQAIGQAMSGAAGGQQAPAVSTGNALWQGARQPTDLASIQQRVLQSFNPANRGQQ